MTSPEAPRPGGGHDRVRTALDALGTGLIALYVGVFAVRNVSTQGDLRTYLTAVQAAEAGRDPYDPHALTAIAGRPIEPFVYPPIVLAALAPLARVSAAGAAALWIGLKLALLAGLVTIWSRWFVPAVGLLPLALVAVFGWNEAALWDLRTGNVALVECGLLWVAFTCFVLGWRWAFTILVAAGACFKLMPTLFLLLPLVPTEGRAPSRRHGLAGLALVVILIGAPMLIGPASHWQWFFRHIPDARVLGDANPGALGLATVLATGAGVPSAGAWAWVAYELAILGASASFLLGAWRTRDPRVWVMTAVFLFVLLEPRPMAYGFVLLGPAPFFFAPRPLRGRVGQLLLALMISAQGLTHAANRQSSSLLYTYAPALLTTLVWLWILASNSGVASPAHVRAPRRRVAADAPDPRRVLA